LRLSSAKCPPEFKPTVLTISPASIADLCRYFLKSESHEWTPTTTAEQSSTQQKDEFLLQLTTVLYKHLNVIAVMDGTVTLYTTLQIAAQEYCQTFNENSTKQTNKARSLPRDEVYEQQLLPSVAVSSHTTQYWIPPSGNGRDKAKSAATVEFVDRSKCAMRIQQTLPILSSSCPAIVCLVEKTYPTMVPHLSTAVSPMIAAARQFWTPIVPFLVEGFSPTTYDDIKVDDRIKEIYRNEFYHLAVMPCHDKKLEASRNDFRMPNLDEESKTLPSSYRPLVDMVITTMELIQLLYDAIILRTRSNVDVDSQQKSCTVPENEMYDIVRQTILSEPISSRNANEHMPIMIDCTELATLHFRHATKNAFAKILHGQVHECTDRGRPYLFTMSNTQTSESAAPSTSSTSPQRNVTGSGGYADYIFRFAAKQIFGVVCPNDASIWNPIVDEENQNRRHGVNQIASGSNQNMMSQLPMRMSVRTASQRKQREYYEAMLLQDSHTRQYYVATTKATVADSRCDSTVVLRFVIAYGMPLVQSVLSSLASTHRGDTAQQQEPEPRFDYIECMACAHSCLNGNGQIRSIADNAVVVVRETPSDIKLRVQSAHKFYPIQQHHVTATREDSTRCNKCEMTLNKDEDLYQNDPSFYTRYHIVPPMQHTMGAAAGLSVQDTMW
jgi:iron only hydrogenase large subunit-like protein